MKDVLKKKNQSKKIMIMKQRIYTQIKNYKYLINALLSNN